MRVGSAIVVVAALLGVALGVPFLAFIAFEWWSTVSLGGWFSYVMVAWVAFWVLFFAWHVVAPAIERRHYMRLGEQVIRRSETSVHGS